MSESDPTPDDTSTDTPSGATQSTDQADSPGGERRAVILASGGMDSATAVYEAMDRGFEPYLLHTSYGQETEDQEYECARDLDSDEIPSSYVPFRNANLLSLAVSYAEANDCTAVFIGAHSEDFSGYPDCRPEFFEAFQQVIEVGTKPETTISLEAPFVEASKTDIAERGLALGVPYEHTWSCYRAEAPACGTCDACAFRLQAFQRLGVRDPIDYAERPDYTED